MDIESYTDALIQELQGYGVSPDEIDDLHVMAAHLHMKGAPPKRGAYDLARHHGVEISTPRPGGAGDDASLEDYQDTVYALLRSNHDLTPEQVEPHTHLIAHGFQKGSSATDTAAAIAATTATS
jgi:protein-tyrosine-phosphatase